MNQRIIPLLTVLAVGCAPAYASPDKEVRVEVRDKPRIIVSKSIGHGDEKEPVTYLGVSTAPVGRTLAAQLGLPRDTGLVVNDVAAESPATEIIKEHDILTKLDDQILVDARQLGVLIRSRNEGDKVTLTLFRAGKEMKVEATLGKREMPKFGLIGPLEGETNVFVRGDHGPVFERLHELPGMETREVKDVIRMIGRSRGDWVGEPGTHVIRRGGDGMTILDLPRGNVVYSDDDGSVEVRAGDGKRELIVKDSAGKLMFEGPIGTKKERDGLPADIKERVSKIEKANISFELDNNFRFDGADVRRLPVPGSKISVPHGLRAIEPAGARPF